MKKIVLTGGGTAGHVTPHIAIIPRLKEMGYEISYIGTYDGIEKKLIEDIGIPYYGISSGKLRRYFSWKNFTDPARVLKGFREAKKILKEIKPDVIFSKGGFVTVPVVFAASKLKIPIVIHESDMTPGLANKLALPKADRVCCNFPETRDTFPEGIATVTGTPIRPELFSGNAENAFKVCGFTEKKPTVLVVGGSTGSVSVNNAIRNCLPKLLTEYNVIHICGKDKTDPIFNGMPGYAQFDYVKKELTDMFALSDLVISRAGANAICELHALHKPNILIPLPLKQSRGDQILNAQSFEKCGYSKVIMEEDIEDDTIVNAVHEVFKNKDKYIEAMSRDREADAITLITGIIDSLTIKEA